jgi:hypothetical protein
MFGGIYIVSMIIMPITAPAHHCVGMILGGIYIVIMILMPITAPVHHCVVEILGGICIVSMISIPNTAPATSLCGSDVGWNLNCKHDIDAHFSSTTLLCGSGVISPDISLKLHDDVIYALCLALFWPDLIFHPAFDSITRYVTLA